LGAELANLPDSAYSPGMDERLTYDEDFYGWSQQQAAVLREMAGRRDLPNALDLEHVAEEIEDVGKAQRSSVENHLRQIFIHLLKAASVDSAELRKDWLGEIGNFHDDTFGRFSNSMRQEIEIDDLWRRAFKTAQLKLEGHGDTLRVPPGSKCPFELDDLVRRDFDPEAALQRVRALVRNTSEQEGRP
jgi:hypothetical protein